MGTPHLKSAVPVLLLLTMQHYGWSGSLVEQLELWQKAGQIDIPPSMGEWSWPEPRPCCFNGGQVPKIGSFFAFFKFCSIDVCILQNVFDFLLISLGLYCYLTYLFYQNIKK